MLSSKVTKAIHYTIVCLFYTLLLVAIIYAFKTYMKEPTAFEENNLDNDIKIPSFTLCPYPQDFDEDFFESFNDVTNGIKRAKSKWSSQIEWMKSYENGTE